LLQSLALTLIFSLGDGMNEIDDDDFDDADSELAERVEYMQQFRDAIRRLHGCESEYAGRDDVIETFADDDLYWSGYVEIFNLIGHPQAKRCYAWSHFTGEEGDDQRYVVVLELPPIDSPHTAVRAAIMAEMKSARDEFEKGRPS
jgi:hypothetical protein